MPTFSKKLVDFTDTQSFTHLITDYVSSPEKVREFVSFDFSPKSFSDAIRLRKQIPVDRKLLKDILTGQYKKMADRIDSSPVTEKNIALLEKPTTFTVTTGHQLNIFTGPLYFIYKIISTINLSVYLKNTFQSFDFVPLYWMAGEDHDLAEINHIHLFGKKIEWQPAGSGAAGRIKCSGISDVLEQMKEMLGDNSNTESVMNLFSKAYKETSNLADATRIIVHELFSSHGLVILDADQAEFKKAFVEEMKDDVLNHSAFKMVGETIRELEKNYKAQVHPREINLFYLGENYRERIVGENDAYRVLNTDLKFSKEELISELEKHPEKFSPNVVLRPLYQEKIIPNVAYVGGPAEISYWLEYRKMFTHYGALLPVLVLRECVMIIDAGTREKLLKLGFVPEDVFMNEEDLVKKYLKLKAGHEFSIETLLADADSLFNETIRQVNQVDPTLNAAVEAEKHKLIKSLRQLEERIIRAEKKKNETAIQQVKKIKEKLFPGGKLQERSENLLTYYSKYGPGFMDVLMEQLTPLEKKFILLVEE